MPLKYTVNILTSGEKKMNVKKQSGFTLVEIAIVLVVIGLLLGGILKGQQLINSARVRNLADQSSGVQAAYYGFIDRFRNLPGDMICAAAVTAVGADITPDNCTTVVGGDGDGRIDSIVEAGAVWSHLSVAGFLTGTYTGITADAATYNVAVANGAVPANAFQGPIMIAHMQNYIDTNAVATTNRLGFSFGGLIPVPLLRDLDQKLDDGVAGSGVVRSAAGAATAETTYDAIVNYTPGGVDCLTVGAGTVDSTWFVDSDNQTCNAVFLY